MITNFIRNIVQFQGTSIFEKARLAATYKGDYDQPNESDIQGIYIKRQRQAILLTLSGKDPETRPQIGFTTIVGKMEQSQSKIYWNYIIKNLIILDRCLEYQFFVQDIAQLSVNYVEQYVEQDQKVKNVGIDYFIRRYYQYIKKKAQIYSNRQTNFNIPQDEKKTYFRSKDPQQIFEELEMCQTLFDEIMDLGNCDRAGLLKYKVNQYVYQLLCYTLLNLYSTNYIAIICLLEKLLEMTLTQAKKFKDCYTLYLKDNEKLITFINARMFIKGFKDISTKDMSKIDYRIISSIDDYIKIAETNSNQIDLPREIQLEPNLIEEEIIFKAVDTMRESIHSVDTNNNGIAKQSQNFEFRQAQQKLTIVPKERVPLVTIEDKFKEQLNRQSPKKNNYIGSTDFNLHVFQAFNSNYSTSYIPIDKQIVNKYSSPKKRERESTIPNNNLTTHLIDNDTKISFQLDNQFQQYISQEQFKAFHNLYCFQKSQPQELALDDFPQQDEDDFPDYIDDENDD